MSYKGQRFEVVMYVMVGDTLTALELRNERETIKLQGEKQCKKARVVR